LHTARGRAIRGATVATVAVLAIAAWATELGADARPAHHAHSAHSAPATTRPRIPATSTVIVYGDSLLTQVRLEVGSRISFERPGVRVIFRDGPGTALCDWLPAMNADGGLGARLVVIEFSGNAFQKPGSCMLGYANTELQKEQKYAHDADVASWLWVSRGAQVVFVGTPEWVTTPPTAGPHPLDAVYRAVARRWASHGVMFTDRTELAVAQRLGGRSGKWVFPFTLPCLASEEGRPDCQNGRIQVRAPDHSHFCPVDPGDNPCGVYSSGVVRFGDALASAAVSRIG
jgi:hypothetical protein